MLRYPHDTSRMLPPSTRLASIALLATLVLVPLLILPGASFYFDITPKIVILLMGVCVALVFARPAAPATREQRWLAWLLAAQALSLVLSTALSTNRVLSLTGTNWRRFGLVVQLAVLLFAWLISGERRDWVLRAIAAGGALAALYGIAQYFGWDPFIPKERYHIGEGVWIIVRPPGPLGHAAYFGVYLVHVVFAGVALASDEGRAWRRVGIAAAGLAGVAVVFSGSRGAMVGLVLGAATLIILRRSPITLRRAAIGAALAVALGGFYLSPAGLLLRARTRWFREDPAGGGRVTLWADTLRMSGHRPLAGFGLETFTSEFPRFLSEDLAARFPERYYESPHNILLDALAAQSLPGFLLLAASAVLGWRAGRSKDAVRTALRAGLLASLVANQFAAFTMPTALLFYTSVAVLCSPRPPVASSPPRPIALWLAAPVFLAAALSLAWADWHLARTRDALDRGAIDQAIAVYERLRRFAPPGFDADLWYSRALAAAAPKAPSAQASILAWQQAFQSAQRAAGHSEERANAWYNLAAFYAVQNDVPHTEKSLRTAIDGAPQWYKPHWTLARLLEQTGRLDAALAESRRAVELDGGKDPEVRQTLKDLEDQVRQQR